MLYESQAISTLVDDVFGTKPKLVKVTDLLGREVKVLYDDYNVAGYYEIKWDGTNMNSEQIGSGIYFIHANVGGRHTYKKVMKLK